VRFWATRRGTVASRLIAASTTGCRDPNHWSMAAAYRSTRSRLGALSCWLRLRFGAVSGWPSPHWSQPSCSTAWLSSRGWSLRRGSWPRSAKIDPAPVSRAVLRGLTPTWHSGAPAPEQGNSDAAAESTERRRREILKGGIPTRREMLKILKGAGVEQKALDQPRGTPVQPITRHCNGCRPGIGCKMLKLARKPRSHHVLRRQQRKKARTTTQHHVSERREVLSRPARIRRRITRLTDLASVLGTRSALLPRVVGGHASRFPATKPSTTRKTNTCARRLYQRCRKLFLDPEAWHLWPLSPRQRGNTFTDTSLNSTSGIATESVWVLMTLLAPSAQSCRPLRSSTVPRWRPRRPSPITAKPRVGSF